VQKLVTLASFSHFDVHNRIVALRAAGQTTKQTAELTGCSLSQVKRIWAMHQAIARPAEG
jgi:DNA invertase Pin-like site-specific DNA recombinase